MSYVVTMVPSARWTRVLVTHGSDELLRAVLPPPSQVKHGQAAARLLEGLSLWLDERLCVALCVDEQALTSCIGLTDELGCGARSLFYAVEVVERRPRRRGTRLRGIGDFRDLRQLMLLAPLGEKR
jgi:hypothetical protein